MIKTKSCEKYIILKLVYLFLFMILLIIISLAYLFYTTSLSAYILFVRKLIVVSFCVVMAIILIGLVRKKSVINILWMKRVCLIAYSLVFLLVLCFVTIVLWSFKIKSPDNVMVNTDFFSEEEVMVIVPHQDDDINLVGGIIEQYVAHGSRVYVVFSTNGDYFGLEQTRLIEAINVLTNIGIQQEDIFFLGFGDQWKAQEQNLKIVNHIYNSMDGECLWTSANNKTKTYGISEHLCYVECDYTRNNFVNNLKSLIKDKRPSVIYAVDYDSHVDHKALDLFFEEVMGQIFSEDSSYKPVVYKGFCYGTAWTAVADFTDSLNLLSTKRPDSVTWENTGTSYIWENRVRIPMGIENLNRILSNNSVYTAFSGYPSQSAYYRSDAVLNGDKVFWERRTDSLLYDAQFYAGNNEVPIWNDFKLKDSTDVTEQEAPSSGVAGAEKIDVFLHDTRTLDMIGLYDSHDVNANILSGYIVFDDESIVDFGQLNKNGDVTYISFPQKQVSSFSIYITSMEGEGAGLSEIEAYYGDSYSKREPEYIMAVDHNDNFVYDYWIESGDSTEFTLYSYPEDDTITFESVEIDFEGDTECFYEIKDGKLKVVCPKGHEVIVTVKTDTNLSTTFTVSNPSIITRFMGEVMQVVNKHYIYTRDAVVIYLENKFN